MEKIQTHIDAMSNRLGIITIEPYSHIDLSNYNNGATIFIEKENFYSPLSFAKGQGKHNNAKQILDFQQYWEYVDGYCCHIVWEKV